MYIKHRQMFEEILKYFNACHTKTSRQDTTLILLKNVTGTCKVYFTIKNSFNG